MKKDYTAWIVFFTVLGAFVVLICAWVLFFWIAAHNKVESVPLEPSPTVHEMPHKAVKKGDSGQ